MRPAEEHTGNPGASNGSPGAATAIGDTFYFSATDGSSGLELWKSDGTSAGTALVKDLHPGVTGSNPSYLTEAGGRLFFTATEPVGGTELWVTDGSTSIGSMIGMNNLVFFSASTAASGLELWRTDGTATGTVMATEVNATGNSQVNLITVAGTSVFFTAYFDASGVELFRFSPIP